MKSMNKAKKEKEELEMQQLTEKEKVEAAKSQEELLSKAAKRKETLDQKEEGLRKDEERIEKEQEVYQRMFVSVQEQMDKAIENNDMVSVKAASEMLNGATNKLDAVKDHKNEQAKIRIDIGAKRK